YAPQKALTEFLDQAVLDSILKEVKGQKAPNDKELSPLMADNYLKFIVNELKPFIDQNYPTLKDKSNTSIMGSSMGGLISMYAMCEYPDIFGSAACLSTHWPLLFRKENPAPQALLKYLEKYLPTPDKGNKIYFDCGTATLDAMYPEYQSKADAILKSKAYPNPQFMSKVFPNEDHSERAWSKRLDLPLIFLLGR
ncbi:MAG: alpha/beta hydrolase, partial [Bacteroidia bacterium]